MHTLLLLSLSLSLSGEPNPPRASVKFEELARFQIPEARQGVAVDANYFYAVGSREIAKYAKDTGRLVKKWQGREDGPIVHLDSGVVFEGKLYAAHSNYPDVPMTSSVEVWDVNTLEHVATHSFGVLWGSCTWIDRYDGHWWAGFGHYNKLQKETHTDNTWTTIVKMDDQWHMLEAWVFPREVIRRFDGMSNSGGSWGPDGLLYCTGHDRAELYRMKLPDAGSTLVLSDIVPIGNTGQGIAWDRSDKWKLFTIRKSDREVVVFRARFSKAGDSE